jgi:hypothetical protein
MIWGSHSGAYEDWCLLQIVSSLSQWSRGLRHEMSSAAQTLGSWVRIPFEGWMSVHVSSVFVLSCVGIGLATGMITRPRGPSNFYKIHLLLLLSSSSAYSPGWALASLTFFEGFVTMIVLQGGVVNPTPNPQLFWRTNGFCQACPP